jgi:hypothetical protein
VNYDLVVRLLVSYGLRRRRAIAGQRIAVLSCGLRCNGRKGRKKYDKQRTSTYEHDVGDDVGSQWHRADVVARVPP